MDLIPQYTLLCGSEGLQNHLIQELISARTLEEKARKDGERDGLRDGEMSEQPENTAKSKREAASHSEMGSK